jgi:copper(I)-binding protein
MRLLSLIFGFFLFTVAISAAEITVTAPWARATAPSAVNGAIYAAIVNTGTVADELIAVSVAPTIAEHVELHAHRKDANGVMSMSPVPTVAIPAQGKAELKPGGFHIMLLGLAHPLSEGQQIPATFVFAHAGRIEAQVLVGGIAALASPVADCCAPSAK